MPSNRIRILCESKNASQIVKDALTAEFPFFWRGSDITFEIACADFGKHLIATGIGLLIIEVKALNAIPSDPALMRATLGAADCDSSFTAADWAGGAKALATVTFTAAAAALEPGTYRLIVRHEDPSGKRNTYISSQIRVIEDHSESESIAAPPIPPTEYYTKPETYALVLSSQAATEIALSAFDDRVGAFAERVDDVEDSQAATATHLVALESGQYSITSDVGLLDDRIESLEIGQNVSRIARQTLILLNADLTPAVNTLAEVTNDPTPANNGTYIKIGAAGTGSWLKSTNDLSGRVTNAEDKIDQVEEKAAPLSVEGTDGDLVITDSLGNIAARINEEGTHLKNLSVLGTITASGEMAFDGATIDAATSRFLNTGDGVAFSVVDDTPARNVAFAITTDGRMLARTHAGNLPPATIKAELIYLPFYGQSLTLGVGSQPLISTTAKYNSLMFNAGLRPLYPLPSGDEDLSLDPSLLTSLIPLQDYSLTSYGESPINGALETFRYRLSVEHGVDPEDDFYRLLGCSPTSPAGLILLKKIGIDNVSINFRYQALIDTIHAAATLAAADGKTLSVPFLSYTQGETDYGDNTLAATWKGWLTALREDVSAEVQSITGESDLTIGVYQTPSHSTYGRAPGLALAQLDLALNHPNFVMTTPLYHFDFSDNVHLTGRSSKWMGCYIGLAAKRVTQRKPTDLKWLPLHATSATTQGNISIVQFHVPAPPLVADTTQVTNPGNWGFNRIVTPANVEIAITSVELFGATAVKIVAAAPIPAGSVLQYAHDATNTGSPYFSLRAGRLYGPRGNIRDSQGDTIIGDPGGLDLPLHNWLPICKITL